MIKTLYIVLFFVSLTFLIQAQSFMDNSVARVGNISISDKEFLERYEMTPGINRHRKSTVESQKIEFLFSLVAEKLWSLEALSRRMDTPPQPAPPGYPGDSPRHRSGGHAPFLRL
jgi:hypothetical protein